MFKLPYLFFDIGGTNTRLAVSQSGTSFSRTKIYPTPREYNEGISILSKFFLEELKSLSPGVIVGGIAGPLNKEKTLSTNPPNLPGWQNKPLQETLSTRFNCPVFLENDTALAGLGEASVGAGKNHNLVAYLTISTGVNGVRLVHKKIEENSLGFEIGHQIIDFDNSFHLGTSSGRGELEDFISGREVAKRFNSDPAKITDQSAWDQIAEFLSVGIANTILYWSPEIIVLGGSMMKKISLDVVSDHLSKRLSIFSKLPPMKKAELGDLGVLYGALHYLTQLDLDEVNAQKV